MSDIEQKTPTTSQTGVTNGQAKSKKRSHAQMAPNNTTLNQFFSFASKRPKLSETEDGVAHAESSNLPAAQMQAQHGQDPATNQKPKGKASTASSASLPHQSPEGTKKHPILPSEESAEKKPQPKDQQKNQRKGSSSARGESHEVDHIDEQMADQESMMDFSHSNVKKPNRDHCNMCKDGGDLLCCDNCPRSFHFKCLQVKESDLPDGEWFCKTCIPIVEKRRKNQEERKVKIEEKERQAQLRKEQREKAMKDKEMDVERKREEKRLEKIRHTEELRSQKEKDLEELRRKMQNDQDRQVSGYGSQNSHIGSGAKNGISPLKSKAGNSTGVESPGRENTDLAQAATKKKKPVAQVNGPSRKVPEEKSEADRAKEAKAQQIKNQMKIFSQVYPELVEKNTIKYPIDDQLIKKLPLLHGSENFPEKPLLKKVLIDGPDFEKLLYIWEFFNNFSDFLKISNFMLEELQAALSFNQQSDNVQLYSQPNPDEEPIWENQMTNKEVQENGFGLVHQLHMALVSVFLKEIKVPDSKAAQKLNEAGEINEDEDQLILTLKRYIEKPDPVWPEYLRIILTSKKAFSFHPLDKTVNDICDKLSECTPINYYTLLSYQEKLELLQTLIDGVHDLNEFRSFLNVRLEEKSGYNKQKIEVYAEIKVLDTQKQDLIKERQAANQGQTNAQKEEEIEALKNSIESASRAQAKDIWKKIDDLQRELNRDAKEMQKIEDQIEKKQAKIEKLNEQILQTSIKNSILGKDSDKNEYWYFKEDPNKLFVKKFDVQHAPSDEDADQQMVIDEEQIGAVQKPQSFNWFYYESEDEFSKLLEACNLKGIRERKLQENLRRIADKMKLKKSKGKGLIKGLSPATGAEVKEESKEDVVMAKEEDEEVKGDATEDQPKVGDKHYVYETDDYYQALVNAVWHGKKMPTKRQVSMEQRGRVGTRKLMGLQIAQEEKPVVSQLKEGPITLESLKKVALEIEALFSDSSIQFQREWDFKHIRDMIIAKIVSSSNVEELAQQIQRLETGFCHPHQLRYKNDKSKPQESDEEQIGSEVSMDECSGKEDNKEGNQDKNVSVLKLRFFKFWPSEDVKSSWRNYIFEDCIKNNLNAMSLVLQILEKATGDFVMKQMEAQMKKLNKQKGNSKAAGASFAKDVKLAKELSKAATFGGRKEKANYRQYFESSEDEEEEQNQSRAQKAQKNQVGRRKKVVDDSDESMSADDSSESEEDEREWDDKCLTCRKGGQLLCCEDCTNVSHLACLGLKQPPEGEWRCDECQFKLSRKRQTRRAEKETHNKKPRGGLRYK